MLTSTVVKQWVEALEGDMYTQTTQRLRQGDKYCCLGVLCDLVQPDEWALPRDPDPDTGDLNVYWHHDSDELPVAASMPEIFDHPPSANEISDLDVFFRLLADHNDRGKNFHEIALIIRKKFHLSSKEPPIND